VLREAALRLPTAADDITQAEVDDIAAAALRYSAPPRESIKTIILKWRWSFSNDLEPLTEAFRKFKPREIFGASELQLFVSQGAGALDRHGRHGRSAPTPRWRPADPVTRYGPLHTSERELAHTSVPVLGPGILFIIYYLIEFYIYT
jgi:hypothetical protein